MISNYMRGDKGPEVVRIQKRLMELGYELPKFGADGDFGDETMTAVENFQRDHGMVMDGVVGASTYAKLFSTQTVVRSSIPEKSYTMVAPPKSLMARYMNKKIMMYAAIGIGGLIVFKMMSGKKRRA